MNINLDYITIMFLLLVSLVYFLSWDIGRVTKLRPVKKRGIKIWSDTLTDGQVLFLKSVKSDIEEYGPNIFIPMNALIKNDNQVIIRVHKKSIGFRWSYIAYIDLNKEKPRIEYRGPSLSLLIKLFVFIILLFLLKYKLDLFFNTNFNGLHKYFYF